MIEPEVAPIDFRIAISLPFSITTMISALMIFRAATRMISVRQMNIPIFSSLKAAKRL